MHNRRKPKTTSSTAKPRPSQNDDADLLRAFVGKSYDEITTHYFSWTGCFFGFYFLVYHKAYFDAFLMLLIEYALMKWPLLCLILYIARGFCINKLYLHFAKRQVAKVKTHHPYATHEELEAFCAAQGGNNPAALTAVIVFAVILDIILLAAAIVASPLWMKSVYPVINSLGH